jgi:hypothetical protein
MVRDLKDYGFEMIRQRRRTGMAQTANRPLDLKVVV